MSCKVSITDYIYRCNLGGSISNGFGKPGQHLKTDHRFAQWSQACLGEMDLSEFSCEQYSVLQTDLILEKILFAFIDKLSERNKIFQKYQPQEIGFLLGTTSINLENYLQLIAKAEEKNVPVLSEFGNKQHWEWLLQNLVEQFPIAGTTMFISNSCASGALAIAEATELVQSGALKACFAGGFDLLNLVAVKGFESLQILSSEPCQPFQEGHHGINLADGGGLVLVECVEDGDGIAEIIGKYDSCDAHHMTQPYPEGKFMELTMKQAIKKSGLTIENIDYINAHGTGTKANDEAEQAAVNRLFGDSQYIFESTKKYTGHTLAGAGALEFCLGVERMLSSSFPKGTNFLSNSFGFGGSNVSLVVKTNG